MTSESRRRSLAAAAVAALLGAGWFYFVAGPAVVDPRHLEPVLHQDTGQHLIGLLFARRSPWSWPLGAIPDLAWPLGTSVAFIDANPWLAVLVRLLSPVLPDEIQLIGLWLLGCFAAQGWAGARLVAVFTPNPLHQILGGALFVLAPVLIFRTGHDTMCAHFLILTMLRLDLEPGRHPLRVALALTIFAAGLHPYDAVFVLVLGAALCARLARDGTLGRRAALAAFAGLVIAAGLVFAAFGYFGGPAVSTPGFGAYAADLLTLVSAQGHARLLPSLPMAPEQYEGLGYLGLGVILLGLAGIAGAWRQRLRVPWRELAPLLVAVAVLTVAAFSTLWRVAGFAILDPRAIASREPRALALGLATVGTMGAATLLVLRRWMDRRRLGHLLIALAALAGVGLGLLLIAPNGSWAPLVQRLVGTFRASGRFIWALHYLVLAAAIAAVVRAWSARAASAMLVAAIAVQLVDVRVVEWADSHFAAKSPSPSTVWSLAAGGWSHLAVVPPSLRDAAGHSCPADDLGQRWLELARVAYRLRLTYNSAYLSRLPLAPAQAQCAEEMARLARGQLDPQTMYVARDGHDRELRAAGAICGRLDRNTVCVTGDRDGPFRAALESAP